jgi:hypothetical protein
MPYAKGARYESGKQCLPNTCVEILDEISSWIMNLNDECRLCLVAGAAGVGKSAIAHTIAWRFDKIGRLGSSFCFSRSDLGNRTPELVFPTVARDLAGYDLAVKKALGDIIHNQPSLRSTRDLQDQFENLILKSTHHLSVTGPLVIVIDAMDESGDAPSRSRLLSVLMNNVARLPCNFRILITSRAENDILKYFTDPSKTLCITNSSSLQGFSTNKDIFTYICAQLVDPHGHHLPEFDDTHCHALVDKSEGLFQWAFVACKVIMGEGKGGLTPFQRYQRLLASVHSATSLDSLYTQVLSQIFDEGDEEDMELFRCIMGLVLTAYEPLSIASLQQLWCHCKDGKKASYSKDNVSSVLQFMGSLLSGTSSSDDVVVHPLHTSFREYLTIPQRSGSFCIGDAFSHADLALACLGVLNSELCFNICGLETSYLRNSQVTNLKAQIEQCILPHLSYACQFWGHHLAQITTLYHLPVLCSYLQSFLHQKSLYWLEVLSLLQSVNIAYSCLSDAITLTKVNIDSLIL